MFSSDFKFSFEKDSRSVLFNLEVESETCWQYSTKITPAQSGEDFKLLSPYLSYQTTQPEQIRNDDEFSGYEKIEGQYKKVAIRVMTKDEFRVSIQDNSEVWGIFGMLTLMSVGFPFLMW